ncbi:hypothetical protein C4564_05010 [Candidatus Microgenomates bacterium]|nr:MAG: hypothetical protein C4564_05010 [Candidatus Microgenomates bacterium]
MLQFTKSLPKRKAYSATLSINLLVIIFVLFMQNFLPPTVPLLYGQPLGESQLAKREFLLIIPISAALVSTVNLIMGKYVKDEFLISVLFGLSFLGTTLSTITTLKIIFLVGNF